MISLRSVSILALALPLAGAAAAAPEPQHGSSAQGAHGSHGGEAHAAPRSGPDCPGRLGNQDGAPKFSDYPAPARLARARYVAPQLTSREVRLHRSTLGAEAANGPNFAANYTIAAWGCGFSCSAAAVINLGTGRVAFPSELRRISTRYARDWVANRPLRYRGMRFNPDSRLLIVLGSAMGDETSESAVFLEWTGNGLRHLATRTRAELCPA